MATYEIKSPDGQTWEVTAPDSASEDEVLAYARSNFKSKQPTDATKYDPTEGMSTTEKVLAGVGKSMVDTGRGIAGLFGANNRAAVEDSRRLDAPLMETGAGMAGNIGGHVLTALTPGMALKGAGAISGALGAGRAANVLGTIGGATLAPTTLKGAAALGGGLGAIQPAVDWGERGSNVLMGAGAGAAGTLPVSERKPRTSLVAS